MTLLSKLGESRRRKLEGFVNERLEPGETLEASLPMTQANVGGLSLLLAEMSLWTLDTGEHFFAVAARPSFYGIAVTDRSVHLVSWRSSVPEQPDEVVATLPRSYVSTREWKRPRFGSGTLVLNLRDKELKVQVPKMHRDDADNLAAVLGGASA